MEDIIRTKLLDYFRNMINGKHLEQLNVDVSKVITFHPFEMNIENLNHTVESMSASPAGLV